MHEMVSAWQEPCEAAVLVAGETSLARLSMITDTIKQVICTGALLKPSSSTHSPAHNQSSLSDPTALTSLITTAACVQASWCT
jgi:hypothetical protein